MGNNSRVPMSVEQRAKQFMPFSALNGLEDAIREKECIIMERPELTEEKAAELNRRIQYLELGGMVSVTYFNQGRYEKIVGLVARNNKTNRQIQVVNTLIHYEDIMDLRYI